MMSFLKVGKARKSTNKSLKSITFNIYIPEITSHGSDRLPTCRLNLHYTFGSLQKQLYGQRKGKKKYIFTKAMVI